MTDRRMNKLCTGYVQELREGLGGPKITYLPLILQKNTSKELADIKQIVQTPYVLGTYPVNTTEEGVPFT